MSEVCGTCGGEGWVQTVGLRVGCGPCSSSGRLPRSEPPMIFVGETRDKDYLFRMAQLGWGRVWTVGTPKQHRPDEPWILDNGAYSDFIRDKPFDEDRYMRRLDAAVREVERGNLSKPYINVVPDKVGKGQHSLHFSLEWLERMPRDWPHYLVVQDGMYQEGDLKENLDLFDGIFLGGTDKFKPTACNWERLARRHGLPFHYGTLRKVRAAFRSRATSLDSSFPLFKRSRFDDFVAYCTQKDPQGQLEWDEWASEIERPK
jgi:hypothetical protein